MSKKSDFVSSVADTAYIAETDLHPEMRFSFVPCLAEERAEIQKRVKIDEAKAVAVWCEELDQRIQGWSFDEVAVSLENVRKLKQPLLARVVSIVIYGDDPGDTDPQSKAKLQNADARLESQEKN